MTRGRGTCVVKVEYKKRNMEDGFVPPVSFDKTFEELGITSGAQLVIIEMRNMQNFGSEDEASEGQEDEMEEMEEELNEGDLEEGSGEANEEEGAQGEQKVDPESKIVDVNAEADKTQAANVTKEDGANASSATAAGAAPE